MSADPVNNKKDFKARYDKNDTRFFYLPEALVLSYQYILSLKCAKTTPLSNLTLVWLKMTGFSLVRWRHIIMIPVLSPILLAPFRIFSSKKL